MATLSRLATTAALALALVSGTSTYAAADQQAAACYKTTVTKTYNANGTLASETTTTEPVACPPATAVEQ